MMNFKFCLLAFVMLITNPVWADWTQVAESEDNVIFHIDRQTIRKDGNRVKFWQLVNYPKPQTLDEVKYLSTRSRQEYDCKQEQRRLLTLTAFDKLNADGKAVAKEEEIGNWKEIPPETVVWKIMKSVCANSLR